MDKFTSYLAINNIENITLEEAEATFFSYRNEKIILNNSFYDDIWNLCDEYANYGLDFNIESDKFSKFAEFINTDVEKLKVWLKTYIISQLGILSFGSIQHILYGIKQLIVNEFYKKKYKFDTNFMDRISEFFSMIPEEGREIKINELLDKLDTCIDEKNTSSSNVQRSLAEFESYFKFNDIINMFWQESSDKSEKLFFFPVWLWWNVSGILPMRPREIVLTPRNCLSVENNNWFLAVRKNRIKGSEKTKSYRIDKDYKTYRYQIPAELAAEIKWYLEETESFPANELNTLFIANPHYAKWERNKPYISRYFTYINLSTSLRYFFQEIVNQRYGYNIIFENNKSEELSDYDINYLHLGDTRHLALINLIAEGSTPMVAMMLAGHDNPEMSSHYYSNIATMIECRTYRQYKKLIKGKQNYIISRQQSKLQVSEFTMLDDKSRCYSKLYKNGDYSDCYKVLGPMGEIGYCNNCTYHRTEGSVFTDSNDIYRDRIIYECKNLEAIVKKVRQGRGEVEEITQILLKIKAADFSYQQYLMETRGTKDAKN